MIEKNKSLLSNSVKLKIKANAELYLLLVPAIIYFVIFRYGPVYGIQIAFKDYDVIDGIWRSSWVGLEHFKRFFSSYHFPILLGNTLGINLYDIVVGFPVPIILAMMLNEVRNASYKKLVQTATYAPHFISNIVTVGIIISFTNPTTGIINVISKALGFEAINFMIMPQWFKTLYVSSEVWQRAGWQSIIYMAALAGVSPEHHEAAVIDGATRIQRIWYISNG